MAARPTGLTTAPCFLITAHAHWAHALRNTDRQQTVLYDCTLSKDCVHRYRREVWDIKTSPTVLISTSSQHQIDLFTMVKYQTDPEKGSNKSTDHSQTQKYHWWWRVECRGGYPSFTRSSREVVGWPNLLCNVGRVDSLGNKEIQNFSPTPFYLSEIHFICGEIPNKFSNKFWTIFIQYKAYCGRYLLWLSLSLSHLLWCPWDNLDSLLGALGVN